MHTMAVAPAAMAASALALTMASDFGVVATPFGVTDNNGRCASFDQHISGDIAGVGARGRHMAVLCANTDFGAAAARRCDQSAGVQMRTSTDGSG